MVDNTALEEMTSRLVHDVRTPLTVLNMLCTTLQAHLAKVPEMQEELKILQEEAEKIDKITTRYREDLRKLL